MSKDQVKKQFGTHADAYAHSPVHAKGASLARLVELVRPAVDWQVLDVASAAGHTAFIFAPHVAHVTVTDITPEMLPVAAKLAAERAIENVSFEIADAEALPFEPGHFDLVTCRIAPHHFPHVERFVAEAYRVLKPGGILAVVDNIVPGVDDGDAGNGGSADELRAAGRYVNEFERLRDPSHGRCLSTSEWSEAVVGVGFGIRHIESLPKRMMFDPWVKRMGADEAMQARLRGMLLDAPPAVIDFLRPEMDGDDVAFYLTELVLIVKK